MIKTFKEFINEALLTDKNTAIEAIQDFCKGNRDRFANKCMLYITGDFTNFPETIGDDIIVVSGMDIPNASKLYDVLKNNADKNIVINDVDLKRWLENEDIFSIIKTAGDITDSHPRIVTSPTPTNDRFEMTKKLIIISTMSFNEIRKIKPEGYAFKNRCSFIDNNKY